MRVLYTKESGETAYVENFREKKAQGILQANVGILHDDEPGWNFSTLS